VDAGGTGHDAAKYCVARLCGNVGYFSEVMHPRELLTQVGDLLGVAYEVAW
jgi:hypothetical protein